MTYQTLLTDSPDEAASFIQRGELVAFPTETVYGLGGSALDRQAVRAIYSAKERPADNPLIVHVSSTDQIPELVTRVSDAGRLLIDAFFPGPLTVVLERSHNVPSNVSAGLTSIAIRMPDHEIALAFIEACGSPVAAPSANRSGRPSPTIWQDVYADMMGRIACILRGEASPLGLESTVIDCRPEVPQLLRAGGVTLEELRRYVPELALPTFDDRAMNPVAHSPGMKYRHYAPMASVRLVCGPEDVIPNENHAYIGVHPHPEPEMLGLHLTCATVEEYAHLLFQFFRRCDRAGITHIYCEATEEKGLGLALMDRIRRAASG